MMIFPTARRRAAVLALATTSAMPTLTLACELDGLSHGYGPVSALFAGAHQYQALNGLVEDDEASPEPPPPSADASPSAEGTRASPGAPPPRRSFVAWARAKPKAPGSSDAPASWASPPVTASADAASASPQGTEPKQRKDAQRAPGGGPVP